MFNFNSLKQAVGAVVAQKNGIAIQLEKLRREREEVTCAAPTKVEVVKLLVAYMQHGAANFEKNFARDLQNVIHKRANFPMLDGGSGGFGNGNSIRILNSANLQNTANIDTLAQGMYFFAAEIFEDAVARRVQAMEWPAGAIDAETRAKRLADLDKKIIELEAQQTLIAEEARQAGIAL